MKFFISYETIVEKEAIDFISDNWKVILEGLVDETDFDRNDIDGLDELWHTEITDRSYGNSDAQFVIENSSNVESDTGLWEGQEPDEALRTQAAFTFSQDVWFEAEKVYKRIAEAIEDRVNGYEIVDDNEIEKGRKVYHSTEDLVIASTYDEDGEFLGVEATQNGRTAFLGASEEVAGWNEGLTEEVTLIVKTIVEEDGDAAYRDIEKALRRLIGERQIEAEVAAAEPTPIEPGSDEERRELRDFIRLGRKTSRSGYPVGSAYIDARCGMLYGKDDHAYVWADREIRKTLPHLVGMSQSGLKAYYKETFGGPTPTNEVEMLQKVERLIAEGADSTELYDIIDEIRAFTAPEAEAAPGL